MNLILFGFKGSGKTFFGKRLSSELKIPFYDLDELTLDLYEEKTGKRYKLRSLYRELGAEGFRSLEQEALFRLKEIKRSVIALGGGTPLEKGSESFLQKLGTLVYLKASPGKLRKRLLQGELPAFIDEKDPEASLEKLFQDRLPRYEKIAAHKIDTDLLDEAGVLGALRSLVVLEGKEI